MTNLRGGEAGRRPWAMLRLGPAWALGDGELLARFVEGGAEAAPAFEALVERHGPMVLRVARAVLGDAHSAEDAFQATFLVLARRAGSIRDRDSAASWLHGVALRVARRARAAEARRRRHERAAGRPDSEPRGPGEDDPGLEVHEAIGHLPGWLRAPVVLCYLEGHTCEDAARLLRRPVGTIKSRLARARDRLRRRLSRLDPSLGSFCLGGSKPIPGRLVAEAARVGAGLASPAPGVVTLAKGMLRAMMIVKAKVAAVALLGAIGFVFAGTIPAQDPPKAEKPAPARADPPAPGVGLDPYIPRDLAVAAGRGTALMYVLDAKGERILEEAALERMKQARADGQGGRGAGSNPEFGPWKEAGRDLRWVVLTGTVDNRGIRQAEARRRGINLAESYPDYRRVDVERQVRRPGGEWSGWAGLEMDRIYQILDQLPRTTPEPRFDLFITTALVDPLPVFLKGDIRGVIPKAVLARLAPGQLPPEPDPIDDQGKPRRAHPTLMIRSFDFTVEPAMSYRYRARVVLGRGQGRVKDTPGPWSGATGEITTPD